MTTKGEGGPYRAPALEPGEPPDEPARPTKTWLSRRSCPCCAAPMFAAREADVRIDACAACGGVWLPNDDARRAIDTGKEAASKLATIAAQARRPAIPSLPAGRAEPRCPDCGQSLARIDHLTVEIDVCALHGTWFDAFELPAVLEARPRRVSDDELRAHLEQRESDERSDRERRYARMREERASAAIDGFIWLLRR